MKTTSLALFAALMLLGWTSLAAGMIASFFGQPDFATRPHHHLQQSPPHVEEERAPLFVDAPCDVHPSDAAVPCGA